MPEPLSDSVTIINRRSTRRFDPARTLADPLLEQILTLATHAPSGYNLQPWRFLVVRTDRNRRRLRACAFNDPKVTEAPVMVIVLGYRNAYETHLEPFLQAQVSLASLTPEAAGEIRGRAASAFARRPDRTEWVLRSSISAAATLMIGAESLGVASSLIEEFDCSRIKEAFGVPDDHVICCLIALGYALESDPFSSRFGLNDVCYKEHFGGPWTLGQ